MNATTQPQKQKLDMVLPIVLVTYFMLLLDNSIVFTGAVKIAQELNLTLAELSWVTNAYALSFGGLLLCGGRLGDILGRKQAFLIGLVIFSLGSLFVGMAQGSFSVILSRGAQGVGSAILAPTSLALLMDTYTGETRIRAISAYAATAGMGASIGLIIGGMFTDYLSWREGFYINVPIGSILFILAWKSFQKTKKQATISIDYIGALTSIIGSVSLVYSLVGSFHTHEARIIALVFIAFFLFWESKTKHPMMPLRIFLDRERFGAYFSRFFFLASMLSVWFLTPQMLQRLLEFSPFTSGLAFFAFTIPNFYFSMKVPKWTKKYGARRLLITGLILTVLGVACLPFFKPEYGYWLGIAIPLFLMGTGQGLVFSPLTSAGIANVSPEDAGAASGILNVMHQLGGSIGLSLVVALTLNVSGEVAMYNAEMIVALCFAILSLLFAIFFIYPNNKIT